VIRTERYIAALILSPILLAAQSRLRTDQQQQTRYAVTDLGTLGGSNSAAYGISNRGWVTGLSTLPDDVITHAILWRNGVLTDIGTPGLNSEAVLPFNERGQVAIEGEDSTSDPLGEDFCGFGTHLGCPPFVWQNGTLIKLPTLGGNNGHASQINNHAEVAGVAENTSIDDTCKVAECVEGPAICPFQVLESKPVLWKNGIPEELPTLNGDPDGAAILINDSGLAAGTSGQCIASAKEALHAVLWENGNIIDLGNLGGSANHHPQYINNPGQVVGYSSLPGDATVHAFLWQKGSMIDLGTLPGDFFSFGEAINDVGQVGGQSCDADFNCRAFVWQNGVMTDLNTLIPSDSPLFLVDVLSINSRGQLVGAAVETSTGEAHPFLATPIHSQGGDVVLNLPGLGATSRARPPIPDSFRRITEQRLGRNRGTGLRGLPTHELVDPGGASSGVSGGSTSDVPVPAEGTTKPGNSLPNLDRFDTDRFSTTSSCTLYGRPCSPNGGSGYPRCCGTLQCEFNGGSTRVGYICK
jgi:probable HAF family extracellular repeat protein